MMRGLNQRDVALVMEIIGGLNPSPELVARVYQQTEGNPLFVEEVARLLTQEGMPATNDLENWDFRLPDGVREVIGRRLDRLSE